VKLTRCPSCHGHIHLDNLVQDASAKSLLAVVAKLPSNLAANVIAYVALFRPERSDLNNERAARMINEVLALTSNQNALANALEQTTLAIQAKRQNNVAQPMKNHSYLSKVLKTIIDNHQSPASVSNRQVKSGAVVKAQGNFETPEQNQQLFEEQMARLGGKA